MPRLTSMAGVIRQVIGDASPILVPDTCSLLDIIRLPHRKPEAVGMIADLSAANKVLAAARGSKLAVVVPFHVAKEWKNNFAEVCKDVNNPENLENYRSAWEAVGPVFGRAVAVPNLKQFALRQSDLRKLCANLLKSSLYLAKRMALVDRGVERCMVRRAPARRGKPLDSIIFEHVLELCRRARNAGMAQPFVFITANSNDYGNPSQPKPPIDAELAAHGITYVDNWAWAARELGL